MMPTLGRVPSIARPLRARESPSLDTLETHAFAQTRGPEYVVRVVARDAGPMLMSGLVAGGAATASAVMGDVVATLRSIAAPEALRPLWEDSMPTSRALDYAARKLG